MSDREELFEDVALRPALLWAEMGRSLSNLGNQMQGPKIWDDKSPIEHASASTALGREKPTPNQDAASNLASWIVYPKPNPNAALRLFCFPYAGGGTVTYRAWVHSLPDTIELALVVLPGRETRLSEPPFRQAAPLVHALSSALQPHLGKKFAFFGHSMGAIVCFELSRHLRRFSGVSPSHLFVSGRAAPQVPDRSTPTYNLPEPQLIQEIRRLNGTAEELLDKPEFTNLILPALRADFELVQTYAYLPESPLDCHITAFGGLNDEDITSDDLAAWKEQTKRRFSLHLFQGDHFFINPQRPHLLKTLQAQLG